MNKADIERLEEAREAMFQIINSTNFKDGFTSIEAVEEILRLELIGVIAKDQSSFKLPEGLDAITIIIINSFFDTLKECESFRRIIVEE